MGNSKNDISNSVRIIPNNIRPKRELSSLLLERKRKKKTTKILVIFYSIRFCTKILRNDNFNQHCIIMYLTVQFYKK